MTLDETYERILLGIEREKREYAIRLLRCLAFARRPLRAEELAEVLAIQFDTAIPRLKTSLRPGDADEAVLSACSTLVTIIEPDEDNEEDDDGDNDSSRVVQFSHYSVKEFLTSERLAKSDKRDLSEYYISPELAHTVLAQTCISTLLQPDLHIEDVTDSFPLAEYAAQNWFHHAQCDGVPPQVQDGMERLFDPDRTHFATWVSIHDIDSHPSQELPKASPLYYATYCGIESLVVHLLITHGLHPNRRESCGHKGTPLRVAVVSGHTSIVRLLLEYTTNVNARDMDGITLLHEAAMSGNFEIAQLLLSHDAVVNALDDCGDSPLHKAVRSQNYGVVGLLLKGGADVNAWNNDGVTPLHDSARSGSLEIVRSLLSYGTDVEAFDCARNSPLYEAVQSQQLDVVDLLLKSGADVNARNGYDLTPLHEAAQSGLFDIAQSLLSHGADVKALDHEKNCPLHKAVQSQQLDVVELLLKAGADVNVWNEDNSTPLHEGTKQGNSEIVQLLLSHGAVIDTLNDEGNSSLGEAGRSRNANVVESRSLFYNVMRKVLKFSCIAALAGTFYLAFMLSQARKTPWHEAAQSRKLYVAKLTAGIMGHSPYFILFLKALSELASWYMSRVRTFGNLHYWFQKTVKRLLVLLAFQWWSIPLRAYRELLGETLEGTPKIFYMGLFITVAISLATCELTYQVALPLAVISWKFKFLHLWILFFMEVCRAFEEFDRE